VTDVTSCDLSAIRQGEDGTDNGPPDGMRLALVGATTRIVDGVDTDEGGSVDDPIGATETTVTTSEHGDEAGVFAASGRWVFNGFPENAASAAHSHSVNNNSYGWMHWSPEVPRKSMLKLGHVGCGHAGSRADHGVCEAVYEDASEGDDDLFSLEWNSDELFPLPAASLPTDGNPTNEVLSGFLRHNGTLTERTTAIILSTGMNGDSALLVSEYDAEVDITRLLCVTMPVVYSVARTRSQLHCAWAGPDQEGDYMRTLLAYQQGDLLGRGPHEMAPDHHLVSEWACLTDGVHESQASSEYLFSDPVVQSQQHKWEVLQICRQLACTCSGFASSN
jgi:hypothetical protein